MLPMKGILYINNIGDFMVRYLDGDNYNIAPINDDEFYHWFNIYIDQDELEMDVQFDLETVEVTTTKKNAESFTETIKYARFPKTDQAV